MFGNKRYYIFQKGFVRENGARIANGNYTTETNLVHSFLPICGRKQHNANFNRPFHHTTRFRG